LERGKCYTLASLNMKVSIEQTYGNTLLFMSLTFEGKKQVSQASLLEKPFLVLLYFRH